MQLWIERLEVGDQLTFIRGFTSNGEEQWNVFRADGNGKRRQVGRMAKRVAGLSEKAELTGRVLAVAHWLKADSEPSFRKRMRRSEWWTVVPEIAV